MTRLIICFIPLVFGYALHAQEKPSNALYLELGGNAYYYSLNFERTFSSGLSARLGLGGIPGSLAIPGLAGRYFGEGSHHVEIMAGLTYMNSTPDDIESLSNRNQLFATAFIGYRLQNPDKKFILKVGYTPLYKIKDSDPERDSRFLFHWVGIAVGLRLNAP